MNLDSFLGRGGRNSPKSQGGAKPLAKILLTYRLESRTCRRQS